MKKLGNLFIQLLVLVFCIAIFSLIWSLDTFASVTMDEIMYHLMVSIEGTNTDTIYSFIFNVIPISLIVATIINMLIFFDSKKNLITLEFSFWKFSKDICIFPIRINKVIKSLCFVIIFIIIGYFYLNKISFFEYFKNQKIQSDFIESNYVEPLDINMEFPEEKKNLIYIFLESMETSYESIENGGLSEESLIPELTKLADKNISFKKGIQSVAGATYTMGALVAQTSSIPIKISVDQVNWDNSKRILPGVTSIGTILKNNGYNQMIMFGSDASFASRGSFFVDHGYEVWDLNTAINKGKMTGDDVVFWGFDDSDLFKYAKEEITKLAKKDEPFNFTMLTVNTHFEDGYLEEICEAKYDDQYSNVIACSSKQVYEFVKWIQQQDFYEDTTVIVVGDHVTMSTKYQATVPEGYTRYIYNAILNSSVTTDNYEREFSVLDMLPTTLVSMGVEIEGDKLGLGVNLFSDEDTLVEKYGLDYINEEFNKKSTFYNEKFILNKKEDS